LINIGPHITSSQSIGASEIHTADVVNGIFRVGLTPPDYVSLINTCNAGGVDILTSWYVFSDFNRLESRAGAGLASQSYLRGSVNGLRALGLYGSASLVNPCVAGDEDILYSIKPG
jgi:hypothetical protein